MTYLYDSQQQIELCDVWNWNFKETKIVMIWKTYTGSLNSQIIELYRSQQIRKKRLTNCLKYICFNTLIVDQIDVKN